MPYIVKKTLNLIKKTNNHYIVAVKRNSLVLYRMLQSLCSKLSSCKYYNKTSEVGHGRKEIRKVHVFPANEQIKSHFPHVSTVVRVYRKTTKKGKTADKIIYYVSDRNLNAKELNTGIRNHWSIENKLHWNKDVNLKEDKMVKQKNAAFLNGLLRSIVISIGYQMTNSIIEFQRQYAHNLELIRYLTE